LNRPVLLPSGNASLTKVAMLSQQECSVLLEKPPREADTGPSLKARRFFRLPSLLPTFRLNRRMSHYSLRGQIMAYCNSLRVLLDDFPTIRNTFFMVGQPNEKKGLKDSSGELKADSRYVSLLALAIPPRRPAVSQRGALSTAHRDAHY
jgi:hypothetical protein